MPTRDKNGGGQIGTPPLAYSDNFGLHLCTPPNFQRPQAFIVPGEESDQIYKFGEGRCAHVQECGIAILPRCKMSLVQDRTPAKARSCNLATLHLCNPAELPFCNTAQTLS